MPGPVWGMLGPRSLLGVGYVQGEWVCPADGYLPPDMGPEGGTKKTEDHSMLDSRDTNRMSTDHGP